MTDTSYGISVPRRQFVAIATSDYEASGTYHALPGVRDEVRVLTDWLCSPELSEHRFDHVHPELTNNPTKHLIESVWANPMRRWTGPDAAVVFVTGHGIVRDGSHRLVLQRTDPNKPMTTALSTAELVGWVKETTTSHLMMVLDLCYAGAAAEEVAKFDAPFPATWLVLASTTKEATARTGALTAAINEFLTDIRSDTGERFNHGPYLKVADFLVEVQWRLARRGQRLAVVQAGLPDLSAFSPCLPNPRHQLADAPNMTRARRDLAIRPADLDAHWGPRARGVATADQPGWLFTGRAKLMRRLIDAATGAPGATLVTGGAGCGKSAALARLVTLVDPLYVNTHIVQVAAIPKDLKPPIGAVDVAVLATGKLPHEVLAQICDALDVPVPKTSASPTLAELRMAWWTWLQARTAPVTIVVDALDEATQPRGLLDDVLAQLEPPAASHRQVRLIVGVRSTSSTATGAVAGADELADLTDTRLDPVRLRVDQHPWWNIDDLVGYATQILTTTNNTPYTTADPGLIDQVARTIAAKAGTSFLVARLAATSLTHRTRPVDPSDPTWLKTLDQGVVGVFRDDLHSTVPDPTDRLRAVHLLRAVAFAYGLGLPWHQIWPRVANAVANDPYRHYGDGDIAWLLGSRLGGYLTTDIEDHTTVYRLFHDALRIALRDEWLTILTAAP